MKAQQLALEKKLEAIAEENERDKSRLQELEPKLAASVTDVARLEKIVDAKERENTVLNTEMELVKLAQKKKDLTS